MTTFITVTATSASVEGELNPWTSPSNVLVRDGVFAECDIPASGFSERLFLVYPAAPLAAMSGKMLTSAQYLGRMYSNGASGSQFVTFNYPDGDEVPEEAVTTTTPGPIMTFTAHSYTARTQQQRLDIAAVLVAGGFETNLSIRNADPGVAHNFQMDDLKLVVGYDDIPSPPSDTGSFRSRGRNWRGR